MNAIMSHQYKKIDFLLIILHNLQKKLFEIENLVFNLNTTSFLKLFLSFF